MEKCCCDFREQKMERAGEARVLKQLLVEFLQLRFVEVCCFGVWICINERQPDILSLGSVFHVFIFGVSFATWTLCKSLQGGILQS